jgi:hypothetical protein
MDKEVLKVDLSTPTAKGFKSFKGKWNGRWNYKNNSVTLLMAGHVIEHISRENSGFIKFMNEAWRVLKIGGQFLISTPYAGSTGFWADPTHVNGCVPQTFYYFDPENPTKLYDAYKPKPWKIERCVWQADGNLEILLIKRNEKK